MLANSPESFVDWITAVQAVGAVDALLASSFTDMVAIAQQTDDWVFEFSETAIPKHDLLNTLQIRRTNLERARKVNHPGMDASIAAVRATRDDSRFRLVYARAVGDFFWMFLDDVGVVRVAVHLLPSHGH